ncbi:MAG: UDP-2,3-diacylglucosamine diphosphatase [Gammaproteobacteria bacterium]|nr:UDP-2,3-diacylglucosamine diphosphatase [Gammaproteobacteria bacterium]
MNDAVFISDLHLHPEMPAITEKFNLFVKWAAKNAKSVYILGDFFHVWPGDDGMDAWSEGIAERLAWLGAQKVLVYFMPGNRDFLLGQTFIRKAKLIRLVEPAVIMLGEERVLLVHGDKYCTKDWSHQWLRLFTRNPWFASWFLRLPYRFRAFLVNGVRQYSQTNTRKVTDKMDIVPKAMFADMHRYDTPALIHGHTHKPGLKVHQDQKLDLRQYTLSDWDENPLILCYNRSKYVFSNVILEKN